LSRPAGRCGTASPTQRARAAPLGARAAGRAAPLTWIYVGCAQRPLDARPLGSCSLLLPATLASGTYEFRLFSQDTYQRLAASPSLQVASTISLIESPRQPSS